MDRILVQGGVRLAGEVAVSGSKNATLALIASAILADSETVLHNVPRLRDVDAMLEILRALGARADWHEYDEHAVRIDARNISRPEAPYDLVRKMRASFLVLGPLLARFGAARVSEPGPLSRSVASLWGLTLLRLWFCLLGGSLEGAFLRYGRRRMRHGTIGGTGEN